MGEASEHRDRAYTFDEILHPSSSQSKPRAKAYFPNTAPVT